MSPSGVAGPQVMLGQWATDQLSGNASDQRLVPQQGEPRTVGITADNRIPSAAQQKQFRDQMATNTLVAEAADADNATPFSTPRQGSIELVPSASGGLAEVRSDSREEYIRKSYWDHLRRTDPNRYKSITGTMDAMPDRWRPSFNEEDALNIRIEQLAHQRDILDAQLKAAGGDMNRVPPQQADDMLLRENYVNEQFLALKDQYPDTFKKLAQDKAKQDAQDQAYRWAKDNWYKSDPAHALGGLWTIAKEQVVRPLGAGGARLGGSLLALKDLAEGDAKEWREVNDAIERMTSPGGLYNRPSELKGGVFENGFDMEKVMPAVSEMMYPLFTYGAAGGMGEVPLVAAGFVTTYNDFFKEAIDNGATSGDAHTMASMGAFFQGVGELISPLPIKDGLSVADMLRAAAKGGGTGAPKRFLQNIVKEIGQETGQDLTRVLTNEVSNRMAGKEIGDTSYSFDQFMETALVTAIATGGYSAASMQRGTPMYHSSIIWAISNPEKFSAAIENDASLSEEQKKAAAERVDLYRKVLAGHGKAPLTSKRMEVADLQVREEMLKKQQKDAIVSDVVSSVTGDPIQDEINKVRSTLANEVGADPATVIEGEAASAKEPKKATEPEPLKTEEAPPAPSKITPEEQMDLDLEGVDAVVDEEVGEVAGGGVKEQRVLRSDEDRPIGFNYTTDQVARERFDIPSLTKIGSGSDRDVYDLGDGRVLKVAKTARGLEQNIYEGEIGEIMPDAHEKGMNYVVMDKVDPAKASDVITYESYEGGEGTTTIGQMLKDLSRFSQRDADNHTAEFQDAMNKYGLNWAMNYNLIWNDFVAKRNWGVKDGHAYHLDGGTFGGVRMLDDYRGKKNLDDADFRDIYNRSRQAKKQFADSDRATMRQKGADQAFNGAEKPSTSRKNIANVISALRKVAPGLKVIVHKTPEGFAKASADAGGRGLSSDAAFWDPKTNEIHINEKEAGDNTLFHEAAHPVLVAALKENPDLLLSFYSELADDPAFARYIAFGEGYADKGDLVVAAEAIVEFMADVAAGKVPVSTKPDSLWQKFKRFISDLLNKLGFDVRSIDLSKPKNVREFAGRFAEAMRTGIKIGGLPQVSRSMGATMQQDVDAMVDGWYSRLDQAVVAKGNTQSGADWLKWAEARAKEGLLSMEEVKWTGLADFLQGKAKVTPKEVRDFLKENRVKVEVKELGAKTDYTKQEVADYMYGRPYDELRDFERQSVDMEYDARRSGMTSQDAGEPKFSQYQLPGGSNYREVLVTLPERDPKVTTREVKKDPSVDYLILDSRPQSFLGNGRLSNWASDMSPEKIREYAFAQAAREGRRVVEIDPASDLAQNLRGQREDWNIADRAYEKINFRSSHFDEPNILVHLRLNDRTGPNGERILFVEELQSDFGQALRKLEASIDNNFDDIVEKMKADGVLKKRCP